MILIIYFALLYICLHLLKVPNWDTLHLDLKKEKKRSLIKKSFNALGELYVIEHITMRHKNVSSGPLI